MALATAMKSQYAFAEHSYTDFVMFESTLPNIAGSIVKIASGRKQK